MKNRKAIALAADFGYQEQVKTIIKSICFHNQFIDFYIHKSVSCNCEGQVAYITAEKTAAYISNEQ